MRDLRFRAWNAETGTMIQLNPRALEAGPKWNVMQFTGLLDKNGRAIFEGDICRNGDWEPNAHAYNYRIEAVVYITNEACFHGWNENGHGMTCEIIGNIYENPELTKEPQCAPAI